MEELEERAAARCKGRISSKWEETYLRDMVLGKDPVVKGMGDEKQESDEELEVDQVSLAATAMAIMVAVLWWLERGM